MQAVRRLRRSPTFSGVSSYADPKLRELIDLALANNRDLRVAILNIDQARAQYRIQRSQSFPQIDAVGSESVSRVPASVSQTGGSITTRQFNANIGLSAYELDLFGRVRSLNGQALGEVSCHWRSTQGDADQPDLGSRQCLSGVVGGSGTARSGSADIEESERKLCT